MDLQKELKKLKDIHPSREYSSKSKLVILASEQFEPAQSFLKLFAISSARFGTALALTAVFIILVVGGFSANRAGDDLISGLDLRGLRAEAQAIDIQIELTRIAYEEDTKTDKTIKIARKITPSSKGEESTITETAKILEEINKPTSTEEATIDGLLEKLTQ